jgi:ATP-binding cassette subfamily B protein
MQKNQQKKQFKIFLRTLGFLKPFLNYTAGAYLFSILSNGTIVVMPLLIRLIIDEGIRSHNIPLIIEYIGLLLLLALVNGVCTFFTGKWTEVASQNVAYQIRNQIHQKLQALSFSFHDQAETGQLLSRAIRDVERIRFLTGRAILRLIEMFLLITGVGGAMLFVNYKLALFTLAAVPLLLWLAYIFGTRIRPLSWLIQKQEATLTTRLEQNLRAASIVKVFAQEETEIAKFQKENHQLFTLNDQEVKLRSAFFPLFNFIAQLGVLIVVILGGVLVMDEQLTMGELVAFLTYVNLFFNPIHRFGMIISAISQAIACGERVFEILDADIEVRDSPQARPLPPVKGSVKFEGVSFSYFKRHTILEDINLEVQPGEVVALLGTTGSGKSSIINLLPRFYDPTAGRILIDGQNIKEYTLASLREHIGIVLQETALFATTIFKNIAFGRPAACEEEVMAAAKAAQAHEFIMQMPQQYQSYVGEKGVTLSGGQKQRVAIARALLTNPKILILDDATSSVDAETEQQIQFALDVLLKGRTAFIIAQRLNTVRRSDMVVVLDKGRIAALARAGNGESPHEKLLRESEVYARIYYQQLRPEVQIENNPASPPLNNQKEGPQLC